VEILRIGSEFGAQFLRAAAVTAWLVVCSFIPALIVGVVICALRLAPTRIVRWIGVVYVEIFRNVPLLVLIFAIFLGLRYAGMPISPWMAAVASLGCYSAAYVAEVLRSGVMTLHAGQSDAADALGFRTAQSWRLILLPQAVRNVIPPLGNLLISMIKNSAVAGASILAIPELMNTARNIQAETFETTQTFIWAAFGYLLLTLSATWAVGIAERRFATYR
jgi:putative glutamine transport system permease protein